MKTLLPPLANKDCNDRKVSIVMPTYNGMGTIENAIESIFEKTTYPNFELIVIDDGSTDKTQDWVLNYKEKNNLSNLKYFRFDKNNGICTALNKGFESAQPNDIIRIDNDIIILMNDWIERFIKTAYSDEKTGIVSAKPLLDLRKVHSCEILAITLGYVSCPNLDIFKGVKEIESNILCCAYIKNKVTRLITNDENYNPCWIEDIDYCINARYHGFRVVTDANIVVYHTWNWKNRDRSKFTEKKFAIVKTVHDKNKIYFQKKWWKFKDITFIRKKYAECPEIIKFATLKNFIKNNFYSFYYDVYDFIKNNFDNFYYNVYDRALGRGGIFLNKHLPALYRFFKKSLRKNIKQKPKICKVGLAVDYLIVGSGLTGSVIARLLTDAGRKVFVVERRFNVGGNVYDSTHHSGIRIHKYGPHYFRTSSKNIWEFVNRFSRFYNYEAVIKAYVDNEFENWPVTADYIKRIMGEKWQPDFKGVPTNFEEAVLAKMPNIIYEKFVKGYTQKQWGIAAHKLSATLAERFDVRADNDPRLKQCKYQGIPTEGYTKFINNMLSDIPVILGFNYLKNRDEIKPKKMLIFTGPIDEFFSFEFGRLLYRGQQREDIYLADIDQYQPCSQVNYPSKDMCSHIRIIEWKHIMPPDSNKNKKGTVITKETSITAKDSERCEYPFPDKKNKLLYERYKAKAKSIPGLLICGRLGEYMYYDMDQAIERAMILTERILKNI